MPSKHLILCHHLLFLPSIFTSIKVLSDEWALRIRWPKYRRFPLELTGLIQDGILGQSEVVATVTVEAVAGRWGADSTKPKIGPGPRSEGLHPEQWPALIHGTLWSAQHSLYDQPEPNQGGLTTSRASSPTRTTRWALSLPSTSCTSLRVTGCQAVPPCVGSMPAACQATRTCTARASGLPRLQPLTPRRTLHRSAQLSCPRPQAGLAGSQPHHVRLGRLLPRARCSERLELKWRLRARREVFRKILEDWAKKGLSWDETWRSS